MSDLIERAKNESAFAPANGVVRELYFKMIDALEDKDKRIAELEAYNEEHQSLSMLQDMCIEKLKAENARLQATLEEVADLDQKLSLMTKECQRLQIHNELLRKEMGK